MCLNFHQANIKTIFHCIHNKVVQNPKKNVFKFFLNIYNIHNTIIQNENIF